MGSLLTRCPRRSTEYTDLSISGDQDVLFASVFDGFVGRTISDLMKKGAHGALAHGIGASALSQVRVGEESMKSGLDMTTSGEHGLVEVLKDT